MTTLLRRAAALALAVGLALGLLLPVGLVSTSPALAAATGPTVVTTARYVVQPAQARIRVTVDATITNPIPDTRTNRYAYSFTYLAVQPGIASPSIVKGPKGAAIRITSRSASSTMLRLDFGTLYGGHSAAVRFAFNLANTGTAANRLVRIGSNLVTFPVWAYASTGASGSRSIVQFPAGYDVNVDAGSFATQSRAADGGVILDSGSLSRPLAFFAYVSAQQPATYRDSSLQVALPDGPVALTLRAWTDDRTWAGRMGSLLARALPLLRADIGVAWPHDGAVIVQEAVNRSAGGYAGLYDAGSETIQVAYWANPSVAIHETTHGWINGTLLADRWAVEGFTSLYAQHAAAALKIASTAPTLTASLQAAAFPLNAWPATPGTNATAEAYGQAASYTLAGLIAKQAGPAALAKVWAAAQARIGAYQPPAGGASTPPETVDGPPDWRGLLDLLEAETGSDFTPLWRTWVVRPDEAALLDERASARSAYTALLGAADGWSVPRPVRDALRAWRFDAATTLIGEARAALSAHAALQAQSAAAGVTLPPTVRRLFEAGDLAGASVEAQHEQAAVEAIADAARRRDDAADDVLARAGLLGEAPGAQLAAASAALAGGDSAAAVLDAQAAAQVWDGAHDEGRRRVLMAGALVVAIGVLALSMLGRLWRGRRRPAPADDAWNDSW